VVGPEGLEKDRKINAMRGQPAKADPLRRKASPAECQTLGPGLAPNKPLDYTCGACIDSSSTGQRPTS